MLEQSPSQSPTEFAQGDRESNEPQYLLWYVDWIYSAIGDCVLRVPVGEMTAWRQDMNVGIESVMVWSLEEMNQPLVQINAPTIR